MTKNALSKNRKLVILISILLIIGLAVTAGMIALPRIIEAYHDSKLDYPQPVGKLIIGTNDALKRVATDYATTKAVQDFHYYGNGTTTKATCNLTIYGYDDTYIYAMDNCQSVDDDGGYAIPTRFTYANNPLRITASVGEGDDDRNPSIESIYPKEMVHALYRIWIQ